MKTKLILYCTFFIIAFFSFSIAGTITSQGSIAFDEIVSKLDSGEKISKYMLKNINYTSQQERYISSKNGYWWKTPEETFTDAYGFCYDLSAFALYCLRKNGYSGAKLLFVCMGNWGRESNSGHFICMVIKNNKYYSIDNGYFKGPFKSFDLLLKSASRDRKVLSYKFFRYEEILFHTRYQDMAIFCETK